MKKYWKSIVVFVLIIASFGTMYAQLTFSASDLPQFIIKKVNGDAKLGKEIVIEGSYGSMSSSQLLISTKDTLYPSEMSFFKKIDRQYSQEILTMKEQFPKFMRGKNDPSSFYKGNDFIGYATIDSKQVGLDRRMEDFYISVDVIDKNGKAVTDFNVKVPEQEKTSYMYVQDVQIIDNQMVVITNNVMKQKNGDYDWDNPNYYVYKLDISTKKIVNHYKFERSSSNKDEQSINYSIVNYSYQPSDYFVYTEETLDETNGEYVDKHLMVHDLKEEKTTELKIPDVFNEAEQKQMEYLSNDNHVYFVSEVEEKNLHVVVFDLKNEKIVNDYTVSLQYDGYKTSNISIKGDKLYYLTKLEDTKWNEVGSLFILDSQTGKELYQGAITLKSKDIDANKLINDLQIYNVIDHSN